MSILTRLLPPSEPALPDALRPLRAADPGRSRAAGSAPAGRRARARASHAPARALARSPTVAGARTLGPRAAGPLAEACRRTRAAFARLTRGAARVENGREVSRLERGRACRGRDWTSRQSSICPSSTRRAASTSRSSPQFPRRTSAASTGPFSSPGASTSGCCASSARDASAPSVPFAATRPRCWGASTRSARRTGWCPTIASGPRTCGAAGRSTTSSSTTRGYAEGMRVPDGVRDLPLCIPIASQIPHAVGLACASRYKGEDSVTMVYFGDGASSHGDCQEAMNFAGVFQAPLVFFCMNNQWAISLPRAKQTHARTLAQKAIAYGFPGIQVDGNDLLACYVATREAVDRARRGRGADADRGPHVPAVAPHHGRRPDEVPGRGRGQGVGGPGAPSPVPAVPRGEGDSRRRRGRGARGRGRRRDPERGRARRGPDAAGTSSTGSTTSTPSRRRSCGPSARSSCASSPRPARRRTGNAPDGT